MASAAIVENAMNALVKLRTGKEVPSQLVPVTMISLKALFEEYPIPFYEFVMLCRNPDHKLFGGCEILSDLRLIQSDGQPHDLVRQIVLAAAEGEEMAMHLVDPLPRP